MCGSTSFEIQYTFYNERCHLPKRQDKYGEGGELGNVQFPVTIWVAIRTSSWNVPDVGSGKQLDAEIERWDAHRISFCRTSKHFESPSLCQSNWFLGSRDTHTHTHINKSVTFSLESPWNYRYMTALAIDSTFIRWSTKSACALIEGRRCVNKHRRCAL